MKGYEDLIAGLLLLVVVLTGGYFYLNSQVIELKKEQKAEKPVRPKIDMSNFASAVKHTE